MTKRTEILLLILFAALIATFYVIRLNIFDRMGLTNDNYSLGYPLRILISTSIQNHIFPLWDHWTHGGYPLDSSLFMIGFSPVAILLSLMGIYSTQTYATEILIIIIVGFIGMYVWLSEYSSKLSAMVIAACFSMSAPYLMQTQLNFEVVASVAIFPWLAYGIRRVLGGRVYGVGVIAFAVWLGSTEGYLGLNLIGWQFIGLYCLVEWVVSTRHAFHLLDLAKKVSWVVGGFTLGALIINFPFLETFVHFGLAFDKIRETGFNPYAASANLYSIFTLVFPNKINMFYTEPKFSAVTGIFYYGFFQALFLIYAVIKRKRNSTIWLLFLFAALSFISSLSPKYLAAVALNSFVPFLNKVRWHVQYLSISMFFLATISSVGLQLFITDKKTSRKWLAIALFFTFCIFTAIRQAGTLFVSPLTYLVYPQMYIFLVLLALLILEPTVPSISYGIIGLLLIEILVTSGDITLLGNNLYYRGLTDPEIATRERAKLETASFIPSSNFRSEKDIHVNQQYYTKEPTMYGYSPVVYPAISRLMKNKDYPILMKQLFYPVDANSYPLASTDIRIGKVKITPNVVETQIEVPSGTHKLIWSSPYVRFWKMSVDGIPRQTYENIFGLTAFSLPQGVHDVQFAYKPPYLVYSFIVSGAAFLTSLALFFIRKDRRPFSYRNKLRRAVK